MFKGMASTTLPKCFHDCVELYIDEAKTGRDAMILECSVCQSAASVGDVLAVDALLQLQ
jgi:hypothetical protein